MMKEGLMASSIVNRIPYLISLLLVISGCTAAPAAPGEETAPSDEPAEATTTPEPVTLAICAPEEAKALSAQPGTAGAALRALFIPDLAHYDSSYRLTDEGAIATIPDETAGTLSRHDDGTITATVTLDDGLAWSDGTPLTAADYALGAATGGDPGIVGAEVVDGSTFILTLTANAPYPYLPDIAPLPAHLPDAETTFTPSLTAGPYWLAADEGSTWQLAANRSYDTAISNITVLFFSDEASAQAAYNEGRCDVLFGSGALTRPAPYIEVLVFNSMSTPGGRTPFFADPAVRGAAVTAIDRSGDLAATTGTDAWTDSLTDPAHWSASNGAAAPATRDSAAAATLLTGADWIDSDGDGTRETTGSTGVYTCGLGEWVIEEGTALTPMLIYPAGDSAREEMARRIADNLGEIGMRVTISAVDAAAYFDPAGPLQTRAFDMALVAMPIEPDPGIAARWVGKDTYIHPLDLVPVYREGLEARWLTTEQQVEVAAMSAIPMADNGFNGLNLSGFCDDAVNFAAAEAVDALGTEALLAAAQMTWTQVRVGQTVLPLYRYSQSDEARSTVCGLSPLPYEPITWNISTWTIDASGSCGG